MTYIIITQSHIKMMTSLHAVFCIITGVQAYVMIQNDILPIQVCTGANELSYQDLTSLYTQCHSDNNSHIICRNDIYFMECSYLQRLLISTLYISAT